MVEMGKVAGDHSPVLVPRDAPGGSDSSNRGDGDACGQHGQGHDHESGGPGPGAVETEAARGVALQVFASSGNMTEMPRGPRPDGRR